MLKSKEQESIESQYQDNVTTNMRNVIKEKEDKKPVNTKQISYVAVAVMSIMLLFAAGILYRSIDRIKSLEKTLDSVEGYINNNIAQPVMADKSTVFEDGTASKKVMGQTKRRKMFYWKIVPHQIKAVKQKTVVKPVRQEVQIVQRARSQPVQESLQVKVHLHQLNLQKIIKILPKKKIIIQKKQLSIKVNMKVIL